MSASTRIPWSSVGEPRCCCQPNCTSSIPPEDEINAITLTESEFDGYLAGGTMSFAFSYSYSEQYALPGGWSAGEANAYIQASSVSGASSHSSFTPISANSCAYGRFSFGSRGTVAISSYLVKDAGSGCTFEPEGGSGVLSQYSDSFAYCALYLNNQNGTYRVLPVIRGSFTWSALLPTPRSAITLTSEANINFAPYAWQSQSITFNGHTLRSGSLWTPGIGQSLCYAGAVNASIAVTFTPSAP